MYNFLLKRDNTITREEFDEDIAKIFKEYDALVESKKIDEKDLKDISGGVFLASKVLSVLASGLAFIPGSSLLSKGETPPPPGVSQTTQTSRGMVRQRSDDGEYGRNVRQNTGVAYGLNARRDARIASIKGELERLHMERERLFNQRLRINRELMSSYDVQRRSMLQTRYRFLLSRHDNIMQQIVELESELSRLENLRILR